MTTEHTIADRATVPQILADLILLGQRVGLPDPVELGASQTNDIATIELGSRDDLHAWLIALGGEGRINTHGFGQNKLLHSDCDLITRRGWPLTLSAVTSVPEDSPLDAETVAGLEAVAGSEPVGSRS